MQTPAQKSAKRRYAQSEKGRAAQSRASAKYQERLLNVERAVWTWRAYFVDREGRYPTREETDTRREEIVRDHASLARASSSPSSPCS